MEGSIIQVVACVNPAIGGPARSVPELVRSLLLQGFRSKIVTLDYPEHGDLPEFAPEVLVSIQANWLARPLRGWSPALSNRLGEEARNALLIHNHGLWMFPNHAAAVVARRHRLPYVISPRGMLDPWALKRNRLLKRLQYLLRERRDLTTASAFHATAESEADQIRAAGWRQPIAVIPNGVHLLSGVPPHLEFLHREVPSTRGKRVVLFLSRLHPKKGIADLLEVWGSLSPQFREGWQLVIAGPDLIGYRSEVGRTIARNPNPSDISLLGPVEGNLKRALLHHAEFLVLPTKGENFGIVVAEALAEGTPVITTQAAPWRCLQEQRCGWWISTELHALRVAIEAAMNCSPGELELLGSRGRDYVRANFSWSSIAAQMGLFYQWLIRGGTRPDFVHV